MTEPMTEPNRTVWAYWEDRPGSTRAPYLDVCLQTISRHAAPLEVHVLGREDAPRWLPDLDVERWERLPAPNFRSDYVRSRVLQRYGGIWIDVDTVVLRPLTELLDELDDTGVVCFGKEQGRFFGGLCAARTGVDFVDAWVANQDKALERFPDWSDLPYATLAQDVTWELARTFPWKALPMEKVAPIPWYQWRRFFSRLESPRHVLAGSPVTVVLWNAVMAPGLRHQSQHDILSSKMLLSRLLRLGLGTSDDEEDGWTNLAALSALRFSVTGQRVESTMRRALPK